MNDPFRDPECTCDNNFSSDAHFLTAYDAQIEIDKEKDAADILALYRQMKLQKQLHVTPGLDPGLREDLIYTNTRLISDIGEKINSENINYPKTFKNLTNDINTNQILWAIQNRNIHMNMNPLNSNPGQDDNS